MFRTISIALLVLLGSTTSSLAGFQSWSIMDKEADPFSGGETVAVNFMTSPRSGVLVMCDTAKPGILVRVIPGFAYEAQMEGFAPTMKFAIDGKILFDAEGETGSVGDNLAISQVTLDAEKGKQFVDAFAAAKKQIAIDSGIAEKPHLLTARGSTSSGQALVACIQKQQSAT